jgi:hypothetical protein
VTIAFGVLLIALGAALVFNYKGLTGFMSQSQWDFKRDASREIQPRFVARLGGVLFLTAGVICFAHVLS